MIVKMYKNCKQTRNYYIILGIYIFALKKGVFISKIIYFTEHKISKNREHIDPSIPPTFKHF